MYLNTHTYFSFLHGTLSVEELLAEAQRCGVRKLALTDINNTSGVLDFIRLAPQYGVEPVVGIEFRRDHRLCYVGIARNNVGFHELNEFLTHCLRGGTNAEADVPDQPPLLPNVSWILVPPALPGAKALSDWIDERLRPIQPALRERVWFGLRRLPSWGGLRIDPARLVLWWPVSFRSPGEHDIHRVLRAVDRNTLLTKLPPEDLADPGEVMLSPDALREQCTDSLSLIDNAERLLEGCGIAFDYHESKNKLSFTGSKALDRELLRRETFAGMRERYGEAG
ncbi:MAG TPA: PHP domain-containing protein, partial [Bacteroidia bacterium]|nr:PHP domain-containing protein [Bacteroidia bacterium]